MAAAVRHDVSVRSVELVVQVSGRRKWIHRPKGVLMFLRRRSWVIASWVVAAGPPVFLLFAQTLAPYPLTGSAEDMLALSLLLGTTTLIQRILSCRIVLAEESLVIEGLLGSREIAYSAVRTVGLDGSGNLEIWTVHGQQYTPLVFMGSLVDRIFRTSDRAALTIRGKLPNKRLTAEEAPLTRVVWVRLCPSADVFLFLGVIAALTAGFIALAA